MDYLKIKIEKMPEPTHPVGWFEILKFTENVTPWFVLGGILWRTVDRVAKHFAESRDGRTNELIDAKITPLTKAITDLTVVMDNMQRNILKDK